MNEVTYQPTSDESVIKTAVVDNDDWVKARSWEFTTTEDNYVSAEMRAHYVRFFYLSDVKIPNFLDTVKLLDVDAHWSQFIRSPNFYPVGIKMVEQRKVFCHDGRSFEIYSSVTRAAGFFMTDFERDELVNRINKPTVDSEIEVLDMFYSEGGIVSIMPGYPGGHSVVIETASGDRRQLDTFVLKDNSPLRQHLLSSMHIEKFRNAIQPGARLSWLERAWNWHVKHNVRHAPKV